ncbi:hypothetical protein [Achromobacter dolens]|uniref:hypothetical protein n=1 Tax=Achromobacter dolens TaxID=1287738 RepID=UPI000E31C275|nr:hypothetical protein [Achromobacter dolens]
MTNPNSAAQAANENPLSDEYVNAIIQRHGYDSPECVIARLHQWIGLHGGENGVTLLMYEAHKALSKLRAPVADERAANIHSLISRFRNATRDDAKNGGRAYFEAARAIEDELRQAVDALASAPVAGEAVTDEMIQAGAKAAREYFDQTGGNDPAVIYRAMRAAAPAAPEGSAEPARILFPSHLRKMWSGGEVQAWLDQHRGVTPPAEAAKGSLARYRQWKAEQDLAAVPCTCPSGDGSLRHPCAAHPAKASGNGGEEWSDS